MATIRRSGLVWVLLFCLVLVNGAMAAPSVAHAEHHGTHQTNAHASVICAWLCAAGHGLDSGSVDFESVLQLIGETTFAGVDQVTVPLSADIFSRGPPVHPR
jgi:hypothetical protein